MELPFCEWFMKTETFMLCVGIKHISGYWRPKHKETDTAIEKRFNLNGRMQAVRYHTPAASNVQ
jgi:hypothetical protein